MEETGRSCHGGHQTLWLWRALGVLFTEDTRCWRKLGILVKEETRHSGQRGSQVFWSWRTPGVLVTMDEKCLAMVHTRCLGYGEHRLIWLWSIPGAQVKNHTRMSSHQRHHGVIQDYSVVSVVNAQSTSHMHAGKYNKSIRVSTHTSCSYILINY